jgi:hypothetical protein
MDIVQHDCDGLRAVVPALTVLTCVMQRWLVGDCLSLVNPPARHMQHIPSVQRAIEHHSSLLDGGLMWSAAHLRPKWATQRAWLPHDPPFAPCNLHDKAVFVVRVGGEPMAVRRCEVPWVRTRMHAGSMKTSNAQRQQATACGQAQHVQCRMNIRSLASARNIDTRLGAARSMKIK